MPAKSAARRKYMELPKEPELVIGPDVNATCLVLDKQFAAYCCCLLVLGDFASELVSCREITKSDETLSLAGFSAVHQVRKDLQKVDRTEKQGHGIFLHWIAFLALYEGIQIVFTSPICSAVLENPANHKTKQLDFLSHHSNTADASGYVCEVKVRNKRVTISLELKEMFLRFTFDWPCPHKSKLKAADYQEWLKDEWSELGHGSKPGLQQLCDLFHYRQSDFIADDIVVNVLGCDGNIEQGNPPSRKNEEPLTPPIQTSALDVPEVTNEKNSDIGSDSLFGPLDDVPICINAIHRLGVSTPATNNVSDIKSDEMFGPVVKLKNTAQAPDQLKSTPASPNIPEWKLLGINNDDMISSRPMVNLKQKTREADSDGIASSNKNPSDIESGDLFANGIMFDLQGNTILALRDVETASSSLNGERQLDLTDKAEPRDIVIKETLSETSRGRLTTQNVQNSENVFDVRQKELARKEMVIDLLATNTAVNTEELFGNEIKSPINLKETKKLHIKGNVPNNNLQLPYSQNQGGVTNVLGSVCHGATKVLGLRDFMVQRVNPEYSGILCGGEDDMEKFLTNKIQNSGVIINKDLQRVAGCPDSSQEDDGDAYTRYYKLGNGYFRIIEELGRGTYGTAYLCTTTVPGQTDPFIFVLKKIHTGKFNVSEALIPLRHAKNCPQVLELYGAYKEDGYMNILMEYAQGRTLLHVLQAGFWNSSDIIDCTEYLLRGLQYLHRNGVVVYDIKALNIVFKKRNDPKSVAFIDWGSSKSSDQHTKFDLRNGTWIFLPPEFEAELQNLKQFDDRLKCVDIWCVGCILFKCLTGRNVWMSVTSNVRETELDRRQKIGIIRRQIQNFKFTVYEEISRMEQISSLLLPSLVHLLTRLLDPVPRSRITVDQALQHLVFIENRKIQIPSTVLDALGNDSEEDISFIDIGRQLDMNTKSVNERFKVWATLCYQGSVIAHVYVYKGTSMKGLYRETESQIENLLPELGKAGYYFKLKDIFKGNIYNDIVIDVKKCK